MQPRGPQADDAGESAHPRQRQHLERQPGSDPTGDDGRHRHRAQPEQQPEARAESRAGEHDEEEDPAAAAGEVEEPEQPGARRQHAEDRDGRSVHGAVPNLERHRDDDERTDERGDERRVGAVGLAGERGGGKPERVQERRRAQDDHEQVHEQRARVS